MDASGIARYWGKADPNYASEPKWHRYGMNDLQKPTAVAA